MNSSVVRFGLVAAALAVPAAAGAQDRPDEFFEARVRPVLARSCHSCHTTTAMGGLRVDSLEALLRGGSSGPAIVPGNPEASLLIRAVAHTHERLKMPMGGAKLADQEIADLSSWVKSGASWPAGPATAAKTGEYAITPEQRAFWSFQPVRKPALPPVANKSWPKSSLDYFVLAQLEERQLQPARAADRRVLLRRAYLDLIGLPPEPAEVDAFLADPDPRAFARVVDRLLARPEYGERWGRYWLDVARYSDDKLDPTGETPYENSHRYRDWVIRAFNEDMPYDTFVKAQIAGDLLGSEEPERYVPALGFYALSPQFQDDRVDATTRGFLGLTVACAQCHDHKFDPIPTRDYYSLLGVFKSTESHDFPTAAAHVVSAYAEQKKSVDAREAALKEFLAAQAGQLADILAHRTARYLVAAWRATAPKGDAQSIADEEKLDRETLDRWLGYLKVPRDHPFLKRWSNLAAGAAPDEVRRAAEEFEALVVSVSGEKKNVDEQNRIRLGGKNDRRDLTNASLVSLERDRYVLWRDIYGDRGVLYYADRKIDRFLAGEWKAHLEELRAELVRAKQALPPHYPFLHAIRDVKEPRDVRIEIRGSASNLGDVAPRRFLSILCDGEPPRFTKGSGRLELADAIASRSNPLTARVMVNRIWQHHFGEGIVRTPSNFGQLGERPSHPELLDYLAARFVEQNWSIKALHREIMLSAAYALSAEHSAANFAVDPENRLVWRANRRRLDAEALRDSLLFVSGQLDRTAGGPAARLTDSNRRRTVYGFISRKKLDPMLGLFDFANPNNTSEARIATNVPLQRLFFANSGFITLAARGLAGRLTAPEEEAKIGEAYRILFGRSPTKPETRAGVEFLRGGGSWEQYAQVLLGSNEFLFVE